MPKAHKTPAPAAGKQPKPRPSVTALTIQNVLLMADIRAMTQPARINRFGECATVSQRAFAEMGKLRRAIESDLKAGQDFTNTMRKIGIRDGTISNSSYAAKVFDLVEQGHLTEAQFDTFSFQDCVSIVRVMSANSRQRLAGPEIAVVLASEPDNFDREFQCIYENGVCLAEKATADAKAAELAAKEKPTPAPAPAADKPKAMSSTTPPPAEEINPETPVATAPEPPAPDNIIPGPGAPAAAAMGAKPAASKLSQVLNLIDTMELLFAELSVEDARKAAPRLMDLANTVCEYCAEPGDVAKAPAKKKAA